MNGFCFFNQNKNIYYVVRFKSFVACVGGEKIELLLNLIHTHAYLTRKRQIPSNVFLLDFRGLVTLILTLKKRKISIRHFINLKTLLIFSHLHVHIIQKLSNVPNILQTNISWQVKSVNLQGPWDKKKNNKLHDDRIKTIQ